MKYYVVAGERSGDLHAGNLIKSLKNHDSQAEVRGFGGDYMASAGAEVVVHYRDLAFMGFWEVVKNLRKIKAYLTLCKQDISQYQPDVVILVDYAGFNLKIAKYVKEKGIPVYYYISPKVWAWNQKRALKIKKLVDRMFVIMPFEKGFYKGFDWEVDYVGNPVLDAIKSHQAERANVQIEGDYVAVLPGSRKQELLQVLPVLTQLVKQFPERQFAVAAVDNLPDELYKDIKGYNNVYLVYDSTYDLLAFARAAIVTSGTATLETALWGVPQVVIYKTSTLSYAIAKRLIRVPYISLVNLIADKEVIRELIQDDLNINSLANELDNLLQNEAYRRSIITSYHQIKKGLDIGRASDNTAQLMLKYLSKKH